MGFLKDLSKWLSAGGKGKKDNLRDATIKLKIFNKRLMKQVKRLEMSAKQARDKAVKLRKEGDMEGSKFQARNYLQVRNQARAVDMFRTSLEGLLFKIENASTLKDVSGIFGQIGQSVATLKNQLSIPQLSEMMKNIDMDMEDFEVTQEIATEGVSNITTDLEVNDSKVDDILNEIDSEIQVEAGGSLPSAGSSQKVKELEDELNRLKSNE